MCSSDLQLQATGGANSHFGDGTLNCHMPWSDNNIYFDYPSGADRVSVAMTPTTGLELFVLHGGVRGRGIWLNNRNLLTVTTPTSTASPGASAFKINSGASPDAPEWMYLWASWGRQLMNAEIIDLLRDPYGCLFGTPRLISAVASPTSPPPPPPSVTYPQLERGIRGLARGITLGRAA